MPDGPTDISAFLADPQALACETDPDSAGQAFQDRSWPAGWTAWGTNSLGEERLYGDAAQARRDDTHRLVLVRTGPVRIRFTRGDLATKDDFECHASVTMELRVSPEAADLKAFRTRVIGSARTFRLGDLHDLLEPKVAPLIGSFVGRHQAAELVDGTYGQAFAEHCSEALAAFCFEAGLTLCAAPALRCESAQFLQFRKQQRRMTRARQRQSWLEEVRQCRRQAHQRHLQHLEPLLDKLQRLADASPDLELAHLVRTFSEQERAEIYEALLKLRPPEEQTAALVVASAEELTVLDPADPRQPVRRVPIRGQAGLLRSVRLDRDRQNRPVLLAGARKGVYLFGADLSRPPQTYALPGDQRQLHGGVNSAALSGDHLLASHSEVGLIRWPLEAPENPELLLVEQTRNAEAVRHVRRLGDRVWLTIDHRVLGLPAEDLRPERATCFEGNAIPVTALHVDELRLLAGTQTGQILVWDLDDPGAPQVLEHGRGRPVGSVQMLPGGGMDRLIFADQSPGVAARFLADAFACRYSGGGQELRWALAAGDLIAAVNTQRDRLLLWHPYQPAEPFAELPLARWTGHSIQDLCLLPESLEIL